MKKFNKKCIICGAGEHPLDPAVKRYVFRNDKRNLQFYICDECASQKVCPQCWGRGEIALKKGHKPMKIEVCDLCFGSGTLDYRKSKTQNLEDYKMIKVPSWVYDNLKQTKLVLERKRLIPDTTLTSPDICPRCKKPMEILKVKYEYKKCLSCGYTQQKINFATAGNIALGMIISLGAAALWQHLSEK